MESRATIVTRWDDASDSSDVIQYLCYLSSTRASSVLLRSRVARS